MPLDLGDFPLCLPAAGEDSEESFSFLAFLLGDVSEETGDLEAFWAISSIKLSSSPSSSSSDGESKTYPKSPAYSNVKKLSTLTELKERWEQKALRMLH